MILREITNKEEWDGFLATCVEKTFLQSWNWGEFNIKNGARIWRFGIFENEKLIAVALILKVSAKRGTFLFVPHGPAFSDKLNTKDKKEILRLFVFF